MTDQERLEIKLKLIERGFWGAEEAGDPTTDIFDAATLKDRLDAKLAKDVYLYSRIISNNSPTRGVVICHLDQEYQLVTAFDYIEAMCRAALVLPEFLRQHPECATDQK